MAVDKLVDSTVLDAGLTTIANAIRAKGGSSDLLSFPNGMAASIAEIPAGGEQLISYATHLNSCFQNAILPKNVELIAPNCTEFGSTFRNAANIETVIIKSDAMVTSVSQMFYFARSQAGGKDPTLKHVTLNVNFEANTGQMFVNQEFLEVIDGIPIDMAHSNTYTAMFGNCHSLCSIRIKPHSVVMDLSISDSPLDIDSLISIANGLSENVSWKTLTLKSDRKSMCDSINGYVNAGEFIKSDSGSISLTEFITNTKGWTVA